MKTKQELVIRALRILGVVGTGQEPSAENVDVVGDMVRPLLDRMEIRRLIGPTDENAIDDAVYEPVATYLAQEASSDFGTIVDPAKFAQATMDLREIASGSPSYAVLSTNYF